MAEQISPILGIKYGYATGESGWGPSMSENLLLADALVQLAVESATTDSDAITPAEGDRYIVPTGAAGAAFTGHDEEVAVYIDGAWDFYTPLEGWHAYVRDESADHLFDGATWVDAHSASVTGVAGPGSSVDNALPRFDGVTGGVLQMSAGRVSDTEGLHGVGAEIKEVTGTSYAVAASDNGKILKFTSGSAVTVTFPEQATLSLPEGFSTGLLQAGAGTVSVATEGTDTAENIDGHTSVEAQWGLAFMTLVTAGSPNTWLFDGRTA